MIEDEKLGLKISTNPEELFWNDVLKNAELEIKAIEKDINETFPMALKLRRELMELAKKHIRELSLKK